MTIRARETYRVFLRIEIPKGSVARQLAEVKGQAPLPVCILMLGLNVALQP